MKSSVGARSSITLSVEELKMVEALRVRLKLKTKIEVVRQGLYLLREQSERAVLREAYQRAAKDLRERTLSEMNELES